MNFRLRLTVLLGICLALQVQECYGDVFEWKLKQGDRFQVTFDQVTHQESEVNVKKVEMDMTLRMEMTWEVLSLDSNRTATIKQQFTRLQVELETPTVEKVEYDSAEKKVPVGMAAKISSAMTVLLGGEFLVKMSPRGKIESVTASDELLEKLRQVAGSMQLRGLFTKEGISETLLQTSAVFPTESITLNDQWTIDRKIASPIGVGQQDLVYTFAEEKEVEGNRLAIFNVSSKFKLAPSDEPNAEQAAIRSQEMSGTLTFDATQGRFVESEVQQSITTATPYREMTTVAKGTSQLTMKLKSIE